MYTCGLVMALSEAHRDIALQQLADAGPFTLGEAQGLCRAVVLEAETPQAAHAWHEWAAQLTGIESVEVVFVHWDEPTEEVTHVVA